MEIKVKDKFKLEDNRVVEVININEFREEEVKYCISFDNEDDVSFTSYEELMKLKKIEED